MRGLLFTIKRNKKIVVFLSIVAIFCLIEWEPIEHETSEERLDKFQIIQMKLSDLEAEMMSVKSKSASNQRKLTEISEKYEELKQMADSNPNNPEIFDEIFENGQRISALKSEQRQDQLKLEKIKWMSTVMESDLRALSENLSQYLAMKLPLLCLFSATPLYVVTVGVFRMSGGILKRFGLLSRHNVLLRYLSHKGHRKPATPKPILTPSLASSTSRIQTDIKCFFHACLYGHQETVRQILAGKDQIDITKIEPVSGQTAFHLAASWGHISIVQQLLNAFGNELCHNLVDVDGKSGLELAAKHGRQEIAYAILCTVKKRHMRDIKWQEAMKSGLKTSIERNNFEIAKLINDKIGDEINKMSSEPHFNAYFVRYYKISKYLNKNSNMQNKNKKDKNERQKKVRDRDIYKEFISHMLQPKKDTKSLDLPSLEEDYECPVCFEYMCPPRNIYSCHNGHLLCSVCLSCPKIKTCPLCRDDFAVRKPIRSIEAEKKAKHYKSID